ncbi:TfoX/Sxy family protein [Rufibacter tibetensis]|uniref:TfoX N-terminal domain-containing protein n=1 Tax=Rufibacter tibetensis TaxID=512763 RepID=A0A0P0CVX8_9BACT|nr:TfoX/Sxy family protein [Rufibacter tibetensis]ALI98514.1 hypothetical protein DC20_05410 [Rufibacter tibetensis]
MPYNEKLAHRIWEQLVDLPTIDEKEMMGGITFLYHEKMCVGVMKDALLCRINPNLYEGALEQNGCRPLDSNGRTMKGWVLDDQEALRYESELKYWIDLALDFNKDAKKSRKKKDGYYLS